MESTAITESIINEATKRKRNERLYGLSCALRLRRGRWCADQRRNVCHAGCSGSRRCAAPVCYLAQYAGHGTLPAGNLRPASGAGPRILHTKRLRPEAGARLRAFVYPCGGVCGGAASAADAGRYGLGAAGVRAEHNGKGAGNGSAGDHGCGLPHSGGPR